MIIETKYNGRLDLGLYMDYLVNSVFRLLPMFEKNEDWKKYLTSLMIELSGLDELSNEISFICLLGKLEGLFQVEDHSTFKSTVFGCITLLKQIKEGEDSAFS